MFYNINKKSPSNFHKFLKKNNQTHLAAFIEIYRREENRNVIWIRVKLIILEFQYRNAINTIRLQKRSAILAAAERKKVYILSERFRRGKTTQLAKIRVGDESKNFPTRYFILRHSVLTASVDLYPLMYVRLLKFNVDIVYIIYIHIRGVLVDILNTGSREKFTFFIFYFKGFFFIRVNH